MKSAVAALLQFTGVLAFMATGLAAAMVKFTPEKWARLVVARGFRSDWLVYPPLPVLLVVAGLAFFVALVAGALRDSWSKVAKKAGVTSHGSARLATTEEVRAQGNGTKGVVLCMENGAVLKQETGPDGKPFFTFKKRKDLICTPVYNVLLEGPPGVGKSAGVFLATLLRDMNRSHVILDPKGALYDKSAGARRAWTDVYRFAPTEPDSAVCNPLLSIDPDSPRSLILAARMALLLLMALKDEKDNSAFYAKNAHPLLTAAFLYALHRLKGPDQSLPGAYDLLFVPTQWEGKTPPEAVKIREIISGLPQHKYRRLRYALESLANDTKSLQTTFGSCRNALEFCQDDLVCRAISGQPGQRGYFTARDLAHGVNPVSLYLIIPFDDAELVKPLTRLVLNQLLLSHKLNRKWDTCYDLDEVVSVGTIPALGRAINQIREYGVQIVLGVQSESQIYDAYNDRAGKAIIDGCRARVSMGLAGREALANLVQDIGKTTILTERETHAVSQKSWLEQTKTKTQGVGANAREVLTADEIRVENGYAFVQLPGCRVYKGPIAFSYAIPYLHKRSLYPANEAAA